MAVSWRHDQLDPPRPVSAPVVRATRHQAVQSSRRRKRTRDRAGASRGKIGGAMAHATKCAAPEENRGRDEWMTVIEMQEYMGASRSKAYDLIWSGGSTRTGSEGSSWFRGRRWTPTSSRGAEGNDGRDRPRSRPRPGTRGSLETKRSQARPRGWCHCAPESGSYRQRQASGCFCKPTPTINSRVP